MWIKDSYNRQIGDMSVSTISLRARSLTPQFPGSRVSLRKVPVARKALKSLISTRHEQIHIKRQGDLAIQRFNTGHRSILAAKKEDWARAEVRLFRRTRHRWAGLKNDLRCEVGKVRTEDVLGTQVQEFTQVRLKARFLEASF